MFRNTPCDMQKFCSGLEENGSEIRKRDTGWIRD